MMKQISFFSLFPIIILLLLSCSETTDEGEALPITNLTIAADSKGNGVILSWDQIQDINGYVVITPDGDSITLDWEQNSYHDDTPQSTGEYIVYSYNSSETGDTSLISSAPYTDPLEATIHAWSNPTEPSSFGWDPSTGKGYLYREYIYPLPPPPDFYLNDNTATFDFTSCDEPPYNGDKTTHILNMGPLDFFEAPTAGYYNTEAVVVDHYYAFSVFGDYYAKVYVISAIIGAEATFTYQFQTIQSLRIF